MKATKAVHLSKLSPESGNVEDLGLRMYTLPELVPILGLSYKTLLKYVHTKKLKGVTVGRKWKVSEDNVKAFLNGDTMPGSTE